MKLLLKLLALILNALPKTDWKPIHLCEVYNDHGLPRPNLVGMADTPVPTTQAVDTIAVTTATGHGSETVDTKETTTYGVCYVSGSGGTPTTSDSLGTTHEADYGGASAWTSDSLMTGLAAGTTYSVRAYGTNSEGTGYGATVEFTTSTPPTVALGSPAHNATGVSVTPDLTFTGTDIESDEIEYQVQVDTSSGFDSTSSYAYTTQAGSANYLRIDGTSAPSSGSTITQVRVRVFAQHEDGIGTVYAFIYEDGDFNGTTLGYCSKQGTSADWGSYATLDAPGAGWSWGAVQALESLIYQNPDVGGHYGRCFKIEIEVTAGAVTTYYFDGSDLISDPGTDWTDDAKAADGLTSGPLLNKLSVTPDATFTGTGDPHPWPSGNEITYTVQAGDTLTASTAYYWRVRGSDDSGATYGAWSPGDSTLGYDKFTTGGGGAAGVPDWPTFQKRGFWGVPVT